MPKGLVFVIGASAGGVEALRTILTDIPADFPAPILIVQHTPENGLGTLADLLARRANIPVVLASDRLVIKEGMAYVAPPGRHMLVEAGRLKLLLGPSINRHRPAIDPLFRSAADDYGTRCVGIVLTGYLDDGTAGLIAVKQAGGKVIVQDPEDAAVPSMPLAAIQYVTPDYTPPLEGVAPIMIGLANEEVGRLVKPSEGGSSTQKAESSEQGTANTNEERRMVDEKDDSAPYDIGMARKTIAVENREPGAEPHNGKVAPFVCPECLGTLWEVDNHNLLQFTCRVGHKFSSETMYNEQAENVEKALWTAVRVLQEHADLSARLAERARKRGHELASVRFDNRFKEATRDSMMLRDLLVKSGLIDDQDSHTAD